ncbi:DNA alkylation repair protein [Companilactobacillus ginsenosidimutans]|uniref:DNA alkylation repair protein n=1 Tax=Companilactobacillus ginsenosidimutans TaxID=1007676 RepID=A0A0H4R0S2_9LACO|nr:DNA alkylation repair protein [Companilactobacillus ginsenosidimutans]AKP67325.1 hypothetical protein ABM34_07080 [Companilactobacillus ginsenosidimutans]
MINNLESVIWTDENYRNFLTELESLGDENYRTRQEKIIVTDYPLIGIKMGELQKIGKSISKGNPKEFLKVAGSENYEVVIIQGYVLANLKLPLEAFEQYCTEYLSKANAWSIVDMVVHFKLILKFRDEFLVVVKKYLKSDNFWFQRTGLVFLLKFYLTPDYIDESLQLTLSVKSDEYYVQMAQAWLFSAAFPKDPGKIYSIISDDPLSKLSKLTVRRIKSLTHTTADEKDKLQSLINN